MMKRILLPFLAFSLLVVGIQPARAQSPVPEAGFGYSVGYVTYDWEELDGQAGVSVVQFASNDDAISCVPDDTGYCTPTPIPLGLDFSFFENVYSEVFVSTNGLLLFDEIPILSYRINYAIPVDSKPQNLIAVYWDDLTLDAETGKVYYKNFAAPCPVGGSASGCTIIEYFNVRKYGEEAAPTFSVAAILYADGNIRIGFQGLPLFPNECTVGIEDDQGIIGYQVVFNETGLAPATMLQFTHPGPGYRAKAFPLVADALLNNNQVDLPFTLRNTGSVADTYTFSYSLTPGSRGPADGWTFTFIDPSGAPITGGLTLQPGLVSQQEIRLRITVPDTAQRGEYARVQIDIDSPNIVPYSLMRQTAVAAPFSLISLDTNRIQIHYQTSQQSYRGPVFLGYTGGPVGMAHQSEAIYLPYWTRVGVDQGSQIYLNTVVARVNAMGNRMGPRPLQDHRLDTLGVRDEYAALATTPGGNGAAVFVRRSSEPTITIYYVKINAAGGALAEPVVLMDNADLLTRTLGHPTVTALSDGRYVISWDYYDTNTEDQSIGDIYYAVFSNNGSLLVPPTSLTGAVYGGLIYSDASLLTLAGDKVLVAYQRYDDATREVDLVYRVLTPGGSTGSEAVIESNVRPSLVDMVVLAENHPLLSWVSQDLIGEYAEVRYAVLSADASSFVSAPTPLIPFDEHPAEKVSVASDSSGYGILVWGEVYTQRLYYALVNSDGAVITPPMSFRQAAPDRQLFLAADGSSLAYCPDTLSWQIALPSVMK
ncbi:MAG TPA: hypothetical protein PKG95_00850 [Anaerolineaceae bacterium]|nr:hypothetical protein [Anaerolineaceae bacterium]